LSRESILDSWAALLKVQDAVGTLRANVDCFVETAEQLFFSEQARRLSNRCEYICLGTLAFFGVVIGGVLASKWTGVFWGGSLAAGRMAGFVLAFLFFSYFIGVAFGALGSVIGERLVFPKRLTALFGAKRSDLAHLDSIKFPLSKAENKPLSWKDVLEGCVEEADQSALNWRVVTK